MKIKLICLLFLLGFGMTFLAQASEPDVSGIDIDAYVNSILSWEYDEALLKAAELRLSYDDNPVLTPNQAILVIERLAQLGANVNYADDFEVRDAFIVAVERNDVNLMEALIGLGYKLSASSSSKALGMALARMDYTLCDKIVAIRLRQAKELSTQELDVLAKALGAAARDNDRKLIDLFLKYGQLHRRGEPLAAAISAGNVDLAELLINKGMVDNLPCESSWVFSDRDCNALEYAAMEMVDLYERGPNRRDAEDSVVAADLGTIQAIIDILLAVGFSPNYTLERVAIEFGVSGGGPHGPHYFSWETIEFRSLMEIPVYYKDISYARYLTELGADPSLIQPFLLLNNRDVGFVRALAELGANIDDISPSIVKNALYESIGERNDPFTAFLLQQYPISPDIRGNFIRTPSDFTDADMVELAITMGDCVSLFKLIKAGFPCTKEEMLSCHVNPYVVSIVSNNLNDLKACVQREASPRPESYDYRDYDPMPNETVPLMWAAAFGRKAMIEHLLQNGHDPNVRYCPINLFNNVPKTALDLAIECGHIECVNLLANVTNAEHDQSETIYGHLMEEGGGRTQTAFAVTGLGSFVTARPGARAGSGAFNPQAASGFSGTFSSMPRVTQSGIETPDITKTPEPVVKIPKPASSVPEVDIIYNQISARRGQIENAYKRNAAVKKQTGSITVLMDIAENGSVSARVTSNSSTFTQSFLNEIKSIVESWSFNVSKPTKYQFKMNFTQA